MAPTSPDKDAKHSSSFWDSMWSLVFLVAVILLGRYFILEPFKIPSGSMEPTLIGHEDYGDRIVTNKMAYVSGLQAALIMAGTAAAILAGFIASQGWRRKRSIFNTALLAVVVLGGMGWLWWKDDIAGQLKRFDVVVFYHESRWENPNVENKKVNYIKRLIGLPGEKIMISGGDLFKFNPQTGNYDIIRMWETKPELQDSLWYPVSRAWVPTSFAALTPEEAGQRGLSEKDVEASRQTLENLRFPWNGAEAGKPGVKEDAKGLELDGASPVDLEYKYQVMNIHIRHGRWPFIHQDCPAAHLEGVQCPGGAIMRNPLCKEEEFTAYVAETGEGIQCPNCKQSMFPISKEKIQNPFFAERTYIYPGSGKPIDFLNASNDVVGNLKLNLELEVTAQGGTIQIEVGGNFHRAKWVIPSAGGAASADEDGAHAVAKPTPALTPGKHKLTLAYVDATVVAALDGDEIDRRKIEVEPLKALALEMKSVVRLKFTGFKGRVTGLGLYRDLIHIPKEPNREREPSRRRVSEKDHTQIFDIPDGEYLMLGDNGPSSADSRVWGFVPADDIIGRASFIWWPPSRWRIIK